MLQLKALTAGYHGISIIKEMSHTFGDGTITAVIGPNGSGKSTLLKAVAGLCDMYGGKICIDDIEKAKLERKEFYRKVCYLPQSQAAGAITVFRLVLHGRFPHLDYPRRYRQADYEACSRAMEQTGILALKDKKVEELSGGQRQKVHIAMALAGEMNIYLLDEPTTYLDVQYQMEMLEMMRVLKQQGKTVIVVLHDLNHALQIADTIILLDQGENIFAGTPEEVMESRIIDRVFQVETQILNGRNGKKYLLLERRQGR